MLAPQQTCLKKGARQESHAWRIFPVPYDLLSIRGRRSHYSRPRVALLAAEGRITFGRESITFSSIPGKECEMETCFHGKEKDLCADWCRGKTGETSFAEFARPEKKRWFPKGRSGSLRICRIPVRDSAPCFLPSVFAGASRGRHRLHALRLQLTKSRFCKIKLSRNYNSS